MKLLADSKHEVIPAIFDRSSNNLKEAVDLANNEGADLFVSIHLNAGGGQGCEAYTWKGEQVPQAVKACSYLKKLGFKTAAMALCDNTLSIDDKRLTKEEKLAIVLGTEGDGLANETIARCDYTVRIPMSHGVDSLNVAAASAVAFYQLTQTEL
jgi:N-acetylmuramoyl-L-alanine amidase